MHILRLSKTDPPNAIDILLISKKENQHYCWIKNFSRLIRIQVTKHKATAYFCKRCLRKFTTQKELEEHILIIKKDTACKIEVPKPGETITFKNFNQSMRVLFVIYADFEAITESIGSTTPDPERPYTKKCQKHAPSAFCYYVKCANKENDKGPIVY